jgi:hypothetical protein
MGEDGLFSPASARFALSDAPYTGSTRSERTLMQSIPLDYVDGGGSSHTAIPRSPSILAHNMRQVAWSNSTENRSTRTASVPDLSASANRVLRLFYGLREASQDAEPDHFLLLRRLADEGVDTEQLRCALRELVERQLLRYFDVNSDAVGRIQATDAGTIAYHRVDEQIASRIAVYLVERVALSHIVTSVQLAVDLGISPLLARACLRTWIAQGLCIGGVGSDSNGAARVYAISPLLQDLAAKRN